jgi:ferric-dicitrate binding protein FerR (iron transport regulator)
MLFLYKANGNIMDRIQDKIEKLIIHHLLGAITTQEQEELDAWINQSPSNKAFFDKICSEKAFEAKYNLYKSVDSEQAFDKFLKKTGNKKTPKFPIHKILKYAAILVLPLTIAAITLFMHKSNLNESGKEQSLIFPGKPQATLILENGKFIMLSPQHSKQIREGVSLLAINAPSGISYSNNNDSSLLNKNNILKTPRGGEYTVKLSDGTIVHLNSASQLKYPVLFGEKSRVVYLTGEAYFDIAKDKKRPFYVVTNDISIRQYGTSFNVDSYSPDFVRVVLVRGSIGVLTQNPQAEYLLKESQMAEYRKADKSVTIKDVNVYPYVAWNEGRLVFENKSLGDIMSTLSLWYDMNVHFDNQNLKNINFTGNVKRDASIGDMMNAIKYTTDVDIHIHGKDVLISKKPQY